MNWGDQTFIQSCAPQLKWVFKFLTDISFAALRRKDLNLERKLVSKMLAHAQVSHARVYQTLPGTFADSLKDLPERFEA